MESKEPAHILVVDDEAEVRTLLRRCFEIEGYRVSEAADGQALRRALAEAAVNLVTLDLSLGGEDGFSLARELRAGCNVPIIMITGKDDPVDRVVGLELGADDYITKPFHLREVVARVRAVLRRYQMSPASNADAAKSPQPATYEFGGMVLCASRRELTSRSGDTIDLTTAEFNMLLMFIERPARVLSRDNIMDLLKGHDWSPYDRSIDTMVGRLRRKIEPDTDSPRFIKTVRGVGYVFAADVKRG